jgi:ribosomal-protein-alanine N-acetyltransferase
MKRVMRAMETADLDSVVGIESRAFTHPWPKQAFEDILFMRPWVLEVDDTLCGYILYHKVLDEAVILNFAIDPDIQGNGHGDYLLKHSLDALAVEGCCHFYLDVRKSNEAAQKLYAKHGFLALGIRKQYYDHPTEDAIVMGMKLPVNSGENT